MKFLVVVAVSMNVSLLNLLIFNKDKFVLDLVVVILSLGDNLLRLTSHSSSCQTDSCRSVDTQDPDILVHIHIDKSRERERGYESECDYVIYFYGRTLQCHGVRR